MSWRYSELITEWQENTISGYPNDAATNCRLTTAKNFALCAQLYKKRNGKEKRKKKLGSIKKAETTRSSSPLLWLFAFVVFEEKTERRQMAHV
jgi:hypothetical protein